MTWLRRIVLSAVALLAACTTEAPPVEETTPEPEPEPEEILPALGLNDVSVLLPIPASLEDPYMVPWSAGARGELLPRAVYDQIPGFPVKPAEGLDYGLMRTIAVRFDGCQPAPGGCQAQIRLVMQPVTADGSTLDSALHLFYALDDTEIAEVTTELRRLRTLAPEVADAPLDVHAAVLAQGIQGPYGFGLTDLVLRYAGEQNLVRMTFFLRAPPLDEVWFFGGFDRVAGELQVMDIVRVGQGNQRVIRTEVAGGWDYDLLPVAPTPEDGQVLFTSAAASVATDEERAAAFASFLRVENPRIYAPDDLPCAGCHMATFITSQAEAMFGLEAAAFSDDTFTSTHDISMRGTAKDNASSLRAFGWFGAEPMISKRVINESAEVCDDLETRFPAE